MWTPTRTSPITSNICSEQTFTRSLTYQPASESPLSSCSSGSPQIYHNFNTSQTPAGKNYLPALRDQGPCATCVAHAVAAAATASVASALRVNASEWSIYPQSLHYCSAGGKTCASGWQIDEALHEVGSMTVCLTWYFSSTAWAAATLACTQLIVQPQAVEPHWMFALHPAFSAAEEQPRHCSPREL